MIHMMFISNNQQAFVMVPILVYVLDIDTSYTSLLMKFFFVDYYSRRKLHALILSIIGFSCYEKFEIQIIAFRCNNSRVIAFKYICFFWSILQIIYNFNENVCRLTCYFNTIPKIRMFKRRS